MKNIHTENFVTVNDIIDFFRTHLFNKIKVIKNKIISDIYRSIDDGFSMTKDSDRNLIEESDQQTIFICFFFENVLFFLGQVNSLLMELNYQPFYVKDSIQNE